MPAITPCLWFDNQAEEAAHFYTSVFKNSQIGAISRYGASGAAVSGKPEGSVLTVTFTLDGQKFMALNGGPQFPFTEAVSFVVSCENQAEIDCYWSKLTEGGEEGQCGWLKDKFGVSWQIVPKDLDEMIRDKDPKKAERVMEALIGMRKIAVGGLREAWEIS